MRSGVIDEFPQLIAVQSENCAPFYETEEQGSSSLVEVTPKPTLAEGIAIGKPARADEVLDMIRRHNVKVITAPEDRILPCREEMANAVSMLNTPQPPHLPPTIATAKNSVRPRTPSSLLRRGLRANINKQFCQEEVAILCTLTTSFRHKIARIWSNFFYGETGPWINTTKRFFPFF